MSQRPVPGILAPRMHAKFRAWLEDKSGIAAVEFALIATPFFFLIFGLLEVCVLFIMSAILDHGLIEASRSIRTGQLQEGGFTQVAFKTAICTELYDLMDCDSKLRLDVKTFDSFSLATNPNVIDPDTGEVNDSDFEFDPGDANDIVVVRAFYEWDLIIPIMSAPLANMSDSRRLLQATVVFRNEPFGG